MSEALNITLQLATEADIPQLIQLEESVSGTNTYSPMLEEEEWREEFGRSKVFLIESGTEVAGNISYEQISSDHLYISGIVVKPEFQGKGIARTILTRLLEENPTTHVELVTHPDNPALKLYESLGFTIDERKENFYGDGEPRLKLSLGK